MVDAATSDASEVRAALQANPDVAYFEQDTEILAQQEPDDPQFSQQYALHNTGQLGGDTPADIEAPAAWDITTGSRDVVVAVVDSGVDYTHEDLYLNICG